jgi:predicted TIM-barrel fold metal-dependent hydrolase
MSAYYFIRADHMVLGSDYPHVIGDLSKSVSTIRDLDIPDSDKSKIFEENGKKS